MALAQQVDALTKTINATQIIVGPSRFELMMSLFGDGGRHIRRTDFVVQHHGTPDWPVAITAIRKGASGEPWTFCGKCYGDGPLFSQFVTGAYFLRAKGGVSIGCMMRVQDHERRDWRTEHQEAIGARTPRVVTTHGPGKMQLAGSLFFGQPCTFTVSAEHSSHPDAATGEWKVVQLSRDDEGTSWHLVMESVKRHETLTGIYDVTTRRGRFYWPSDLA